MRGARVRDSGFRFPTTVRMFGNGNRESWGSVIGPQGSNPCPSDGRGPG